MKPSRLRDVVFSNVFYNLFPHCVALVSKLVWTLKPALKTYRMSSKLFNEFLTLSILGWNLDGKRPVVPCVIHGDFKAWHSSAVIWPRWPTPLVQLFSESEETDIQSLNLKCWGGRQHEIFADLQIITRSFSHTRALVFSSIVAPLWTFAAFSCSAKHRVLSSLPPLLRLWRTSRTATDWNDNR